MSTTPSVPRLSGLVFVSVVVGVLVLLLTSRAAPSAGAQAPTSTPAPLQITTVSLPNATVGQLYTQQLQASGGTAPLTWQLTQGQLPPNILLDPATGILSGRPQP